MHSGPSLRPPGTDAAIALALAALGVVEVATGAVGGAAGAAVPTSLAGALVVAWRRRFPVSVAALAIGTLALQTALGVPPDSIASLVAALLAIYSAAEYRPLAPAIAALSLVLVGAWASVLFSDGGASDFAYVLFLVGSAWGAGRVVRGLGLHAERLEDRAARLEREQEERARAAAEAERARIARELHDIVAHGVSVMVVQAGAAERMLGSDPAGAREALRSVRDTGSQALVEMRRMVGLLRIGGDAQELAPQPGLGDLDELVRQVRDAGLSVEVRVEGEPQPLQRGIDLSAYRILQEALTNARKHAGPAHARLTVRWLPTILELEVQDDGAGRANGAGGGHGLVGMRERVSFYGGQLEAGNRPEGGYSVRARLPLSRTVP